VAGPRVANPVDRSTVQFGIGFLAATTDGVRMKTDDLGESGVPAVAEFLRLKCSHRRCCSSRRLRTRLRFRWRFRSG
jgi:hypothetical protein